MILRQRDAGAPIIVRSDSLPLSDIQLPVQLEPRVRELLNVIPGYVWVLDAYTMLYASVDARALDSASVAQLNTSPKGIRAGRATSRHVRLGRAGGCYQPGARVGRLETISTAQTLRVVAAVPLSAVSLSPKEI